MKKALLVTGLVLTIATSVISGTMAVYTKQIDVMAESISAKQFALEVNSPQVAFKNLEGIAPGEDLVYTFNVTNFKDKYISQTDMKLAIQVGLEFPDNYDALPLTYSLYDLTDGTASTAPVATGEESSADKGLVVNYDPGTLAFTAGKEATRSYKLVVHWNSANNAADTALQGKTGATMKVTVIGTQVAGTTDKTLPVSSPSSPVS